MAQFFQIEGTQQVFMVQRNDSIGLQFATQESGSVSQTNTAVLQHPQGVLLTDGIVRQQNNSTIEVVRYANSQPPALYYHARQAVVEPQQNELVVDSQEAQQATIQIQQIPQFRQLQGTLVGNQVVHNHITNETYEVTVEETDEQVEDGEVLYEGELTDDVDGESENAQSVISSTNEMEDEPGDPQLLHQNSQVAPNVAQSPAVYNQVVQQQIVQSVASQPCVMQQIPVVQRTVPVQQHHLMTSDGAQVSATGNSAVTQGYIIGTQAASQAVRSVYIHQPIQTENMLQGQQQRQVLQVKQQPQVLHQLKEQPQALPQVRQQPQVLQVKQQQILQVKQQPQVIQSVHQQHQVIQSVPQQPQVVQPIQQQPQIIQSVKQSQEVHTVKQQSQVIQQVKLQTPMIKQPQKEISKETSILQTFTTAGIKVTKTVAPDGSGNIQPNSLYRSGTARKRRPPNITRRSVPISKVDLIQQSDENLQVQMPIPHAVEFPSTESIDLPPSRLDEIIHLAKTELISNSYISQEQQTPSRTFLPLKSRFLQKYQQSSEVEAQSPQGPVLESPQNSPNTVVQIAETPNISTSLTPQIKQLVFQTPPKRVHTYPSPKNRLITKSLTNELTDPASSQQPAQQQEVQHPTLLIKRDPQIQKQSPVTTPRKDQMVLVVPPNRGLMQGNANIRVSAGSKVVQTLTLNEVHRAVRDGTISLKPEGSQGLVLASGGNVVVLKSDNSLMSSDGIKKVTCSDGIMPPEVVKIIPGKLAVCTYCGLTSTNFNRCSRCRRNFPPDCKAVDSVAAANGILTPDKIKKTVILDTEPFLDDQLPGEY